MERREPVTDGLHRSSVALTRTNMSDETIDLLCENCGQTFSVFLHQMADKNAKVVCPNCRGSRDCNPANAAQPVAGTGSVRKII